MDAALHTLLIPAAASIVVALITGFWAWAQGRKKGSADIQVALNSGFADLVKKLQEERVELTKVIDRQAAKIVSLEATVSRLEDKVDDMMRRWRRGETAPAPENRE